MNSFFHILLSQNFIFSVIRVTTPILLAALGALISDRAGVVNIGLEGIMLSSALAGVLMSSLTNTFIGFIFALVVGVLMALTLAYFTLELKTHVILGGIAINMLASGGTVFILYLVTGNKGNSSSIRSGTVPDLNIPIIKDIPYIGGVLSGQNVITYLAIGIIIFVWVLLNRTSLGMKIRAVGENSAAAESVGINVKKIQYFALALSGLFAGMGGAFLSMAYYTGFTRDMSAGRGWIALAAEAMGRGTVIGTALSSLIFGCADALTYHLRMLNVPSELVGTIPYVTTVIGLSFYAVMETNKRKRKLLKKSNS